jgi:Rad3-related DNA helicase
MSATVVDKDTFCKSVGVDPNDAAYLRLPSPFPLENRPIHYLGVGSMSMNFIDSTLPKLAETVRSLLDLHATEKGIIHCVNYKIAQYLVEKLKDKRLLIHTSENRDETIEKHLSSKEPTVLISPSMMEGVDLADEASRFQILCKVPFPYLGDRVIQLRKARSNTWYSMMTARAVIQAFGRSIRNDTDHATSYILDSDWERFYRTNAQMFPTEFSSALQ